MTTDTETSDPVAPDVYRCTGERIGQANDVYLDGSRRPAWVSVTTGLFETHLSFIPLTDAAITPSRITVIFSKDHIRDSPTVEPVEAHLTPDDERSLKAHYGIAAEAAPGAGAHDDAFGTS